MTGEQMRNNRPLEVEAQAPDESATTTPRKRRRVWRWLVACVILLVGGSLYFHAFCHRSLHSDDWSRERAGGAITKGLDYLYETGTFAKPAENGGESPPHHFFLELVLNRHEHVGLRRQMDEAKLVNMDNWQWRAFFGMPGWPRYKLTADDRRDIRNAVMTSKKNYYAEWLLYGLYPDWTELRPAERRRLLEDTSRLKHSYQLTHALVAYLWMKETNPAAAEKYDVDRLVREVCERIEDAHKWDPATSDIYNERVAFLLYAGQDQRVRRRWIERIILSQNTDGGWSYDKSITRTIAQFIGLDAGKVKSDTHATFLALYALSEYTGRM